MIYGLGELVTHGDPVPSELQEEYLERYRGIVDMINRFLSDWNKKWNQLWPEPMEEDTMVWDIYGQFLTSFERDLCISDNFEHQDSRLFMDSVPDKGEPKIIAIIDRDRNHWMECKFDIGR